MNSSQQASFSVDDIVSKILSEAKHDEKDWDDDDDEESKFRREHEKEEEKAIVGNIAKMLGVGSNAISGIINKALNKLQFLHTELPHEDLAGMIETAGADFIDQLERKKLRLSRQDVQEAWWFGVPDSLRPEYQKLVNEYIDYLESSNKIPDEELAQMSDLTPEDLSPIPLDDNDKGSFTELRKYWKALLFSSDFWNWAEMDDYAALIGVSRPWEDVDVVFLDQNWEILFQMTSFREFLQKYINKISDARRGHHQWYVDYKSRKYTG